MGQAGVSKALDIIRNELDISMILTGTRDVLYNPSPRSYSRN
jgi:isopentenyl diphosphate isomerase/L-lactate dehydrogenase-like FMN-dependent dehydrogenase